MVDLVGVMNFEDYQRALLYQAEEFAKLSEASKKKDNTIRDLAKEILRLRDFREGDQEIIEILKREKAQLEERIAEFEARIEEMC